MALRWERSSNGHVPKDAVQGGWDPEKEQALYVGRARHNGSLHPGKVHPGHRCILVCYGDDAVRYNDYEVLVNPGNRVHLEWIHDKDGRVPANAVEGGQNPEGEAYYIGRHSHRGHTLIGKIHTRKRCLYVPFGDKSVVKSEYTVLVKH